LKGDEINAESSASSPADTTVNNKNIEDNKENNDFDTPTASGATNNQNIKGDSAEHQEQESTEVSKEKQARHIANDLLKTLSKSSKSNLFKKFLAGCVNSKLKEDLKAARGSKASANKSGDDDEEDEEEDEDVKELLDDGVLDEDSEEEEETDEDEEEEDDEEDDDEDDEEGEDEEEDEDEAAEDDEDDEEEDYDSAMGYGQESRPGFDSGCTAVVALLANNKNLYVANAGDSRCIVCRDGKAIDMSVDHKPEDDIERERINKGMNKYFVSKHLL
jgi:protein phosphatase 1G